MIDHHYTDHEKRKAMSQFDPEGCPPKTSGNEGAKVSVKAKIIRGVVGFFITFIIIFVATNIVMAQIRVELPSFLINSLSVSNFNSTKTQLEGKWDANFTVVNPDHWLSIYIARVDFILTYRNHAISSAKSEPHLKVGPNKNGIIPVKINRKRWKRKKGIPEPSEEIVEAKKNGTLAFKIYMISTSIVLPGTWWESRMSMYYECDDLRLQFESETNGAVMFNPGRTCLLGGI